MPRPIPLPMSPMRVAPNSTTTMARMMRSSVGPMLWNIRNGIASPPALPTQHSTRPLPRQPLSPGAPLYGEHEDKEEQRGREGGQADLPEAADQKEDTQCGRKAEARYDEDARHHDAQRHLTGGR